MTKGKQITLNSTNPQDYNIVATTPEAKAALQKAYRDKTLDLIMDESSSVEFAGKNIPTGTLKNNSHLKVSKGVSVQEIKMDDSTITWTKGSIKDSEFENSSSANNGLEDSGGYLTKVHALNSQISMNDNHISNTTLDNVSVGNITSNNSSLKVAKGHTTGSKSEIISSKFTKSNVMIGPNSTILDSALTNAIIKTNLNTSLNNTQLSAVRLNDVNTLPKTQTGYTLSDSTVADVISAVPITASASNISGKPWHPVVINSHLDVTNVILNSTKGAIVSNQFNQQPDRSDDEPVILGNAQRKIEITDKDLAHNVNGFELNKNSSRFKKLSTMVHGQYGYGLSDNNIANKVNSLVKSTAHSVRSLDEPEL